MHTIMTGDCLEILPQIGTGLFDVIVTSPPYNLAVDYGDFDDARPEADYLDWLMRVVVQLKRVLKPGGSLFLNLGASAQNPWLPFEAVPRLRRLFELQNTIIWVKSIDTGAGAVGHFKPIGGHRFLHLAHEHIFHLTHEGDVPLDRLAVGVPYKDKANIARRGHARDLRCRGNTWFIPYETVQSRAGKHGHRAGFPVDLPRWCIRLHGVPGALVLDPFMGTGTTLVAASAEGASGVGVERNPAFVAAALDRMRNETAAAGPCGGGSAVRARPGKGGVRKPALGVLQGGLFAIAAE